MEFCVLFAKDHLEFSDEAVRFSVPAWLLELWKESYDETTRQKMLTYFLEDHPLTVRCNIHLASKEDFASLKDQQVNVEKCPYGDSMLYLSGYDHLEALRSGPEWLDPGAGSKLQPGGYGSSSKRGFPGAGCVRSAGRKEPSYRRSVKGKRTRNGS